MSEIEERVKQIIVDKLGVSESEVTPEATFNQDLGADSLDTVELIMEFEKQFDIKIPDDKSETIQNRHQIHRRSKGRRINSLNFQITTWN